MAGTIKYGAKVDLSKNELLNAVIQNLSGAPGMPKAGEIYFDTVLKEFGYYNGTEWVYGTTLAEATETVLGGIKLAEDLKGGTATKPKVSGLHLTADTAIGHKLTTVTDPTEAQDAATKKYVDKTASGLTWKVPVAYATTGALPSNEISGEKIIATTKVVLEPDGAAVVVGQRILVKNQAEAKDDGIYEVVKKGAAGTEFWELVRTADATTTALLQDATMFAEKGTANEGHEFTQTAKVTTVGTTAQVWVEVQSGLAITAETPYLERVANAIKVKPMTAKHAVDPGSEAGVGVAIIGNARIKNFALNLASGTTEIKIKHELKTEQVVFQAFENNAGVPGTPIELAWEPEGENEVKVSWPEAPAAKTIYFVTIVG